MLVMMWTRYGRSELGGFQLLQQSIPLFRIGQQRYSFVNPAAGNQNVQKRLQDQEQLSTHKAEGLVRIQQRDSRNGQPSANQLLRDSLG